MCYQSCELGARIGRNDVKTKTMTRREFLRFGAASLALLALPSGPLFASVPASEAPPASLGRIATWWRQNVHKETSPDADVVTTKGRDEIIPLYAAVDGVNPQAGRQEQMGQFVGPFRAIQGGLRRLLERCDGVTPLLVIRRDSVNGDHAPSCLHPGLVDTLVQ